MVKSFKDKIDEVGMFIKSEHDLLALIKEFKGEGYIVPLTAFESQNSKTKQTEEPAQEEPKYKMTTIDEFWNPEKRLAIHTSTKEQAELLCKVFDKMGKKWIDGSSYIEDSSWDVFEENTCYLNNNKFSDIDREED